MTAGARDRRPARVGRGRLAGAMTATPAAIALTAAMAVAVPRTPSAAATDPCDVTYTVNQWPGGFTADVKVTNNSAAVTSWTLTWTFDGDQKVTSAWNAQVTQNGRSVTARDDGYNGTLPTGGSTDFGFQGTFSGQNAAPSDFALNGVPCNGGGDGGGGGPAPTPTPTPTPCTQAAFCDGFEGQTGGTPSGAWQASYPDCQGSGTVSIDRTQAHSGSASLRVDGGTGYCNHAFALNTTGMAAVGGVKYVRFWVRHTTALPAGHVAFVTMTDAADGGRHLRLGGQNQALQWNRESDDATLPEQSPAGVAMSVPLPVNQWECVEFMVDGPSGAMSTWLNGTEVAGLHLDSTPTPDVDRQWLSRGDWHPNPTNLSLGWESYGGGTDTLWFDDVAVNSTRIGC